MMACEMIIPGIFCQQTDGKKMAGETPTIGTELNRGGGGYLPGTDLLKLKLMKVASEALLFKRCSK